MKKIKNLIRFVFISAIMAVVVGWTARLLFKLIWNFDILSRHSYTVVYDYWENGGVFNTFKDCSLGLLLFLLPIIWLILSYKLYKYGLLKFIFSPVGKLYRRLTRPKVMEIEPVSIKNLGGKDLTLDEIIAQKMEKEGISKKSEHTTQELRKQIAAKIRENENQ